MDMDEETSILYIQSIFSKFDRAHEFNNNILQFHVPISNTGHSIIDDVYELLRCIENRQMVEDMLLLALQDIALKIIEKNGDENGLSV